MRTTQLMKFFSKIRFIDCSLILGIYRIRADGGHVELVRSDIAAAAGISLLGQTMYWTDNRLEKVFSAARLVIRIKILFCYGN